MAGEGERTVRVGDQAFNVPADMTQDDIMAAVGGVDPGFANGRIREDEGTHELVVERVAGVKG